MSTERHSREVKTRLHVELRPFLENANAAAMAIAAFDASNSRAAIKHEQDLVNLRAVVPDENERQGYLDVTMGNAVIAYRIACHGISVDTAAEMRAAGVPAEWIPDLAEYGPERAKQIADVLWEFIPYEFIPEPHVINRMMVSIDITVGVIEADGTLRTENPPLPQPDLSTPEAFRARALEARRNRGTGPTRRDNRRWRNQ